MDADAGSALLVRQANPKRFSVFFIFSVAFAVVLFVLRSGPAIGLLRPQRSLTVFESMRASEDAAVLLTYLFKPAPSRPLHGHCTQEPSIPNGRKIDLSEYTRLVALKACCTGTALLLVTQDETEGLFACSCMEHTTPMA